MSPSLRHPLARKPNLTTNFISFIHGAAIAFSVLSLLWVFIAMDGFYRKFTGGRTVFTNNDERRPLLGQ